MPRPAEIQAIIEEAVAEVFAAALPGLRAEIVGRAAKEIEALTPAPGESPTGILSAAMASIQEASSQAEILRSLLEGEARFAGRVALFVVKGGAVNGWQGIGFEDNDIIKTVNLNAASGLAGRAIQGRAPAAGRAADFDSGFLKTVKPPVENNCLVLPLVVKEKVAALIYADAGSIPGSVDASALSVLTRVAALWLEVTAMRKTGAAPAEEAQAAAAAAAPIPSATLAPAPVEDELHKKAKRFAKLLVEEIKLYNQPRVAEGKHNRDLYDRLREDIEKSRATYEKRYGESPVAAANYFNQELIRVLADNDVSLMGASFPR